MPNTTYSTPQPPPKVGDLLEDIGHDLRTIAVDELELAKGKLATYLEAQVLKAAGAIIGACVALIGLGFLCLAAVAALEPVIHPVWLRLFLMSIVYLAVGGTIAAMFAKRLADSRGPDLTHEKAEAKETVAAVQRGLEH
jgi:hypothetical protein